jgi:hypothetical protein
MYLTLWKKIRGRDSSSLLLVIRYLGFLEWRGVPTLGWEEYRRQDRIPGAAEVWAEVWESKANATQKKDGLASSLIAVIKYTIRTNLQERGFILNYNSKHSASQWGSKRCSWSHLVYSQEVEKGECCLALLYLHRMESHPENGTIHSGHIHSSMGVVRGSSPRWF